MSTQAAPLARPLGSPLRTYPLGTGVRRPPVGMAYVYFIDAAGRAQVVTTTDRYLTTRPIVSEA